MKNVLVISYYFPPDIAVGALRGKWLYDYLSDYGWNPIILTKHNPNRTITIADEIHETPNKESMGLIRKILNIDQSQSLLPQIQELKQKYHLTHFNFLIDKIISIIAEISAYPDPQKNWYIPAKFKAQEIIEVREYTPNKINAIISTSSPVTSHIIANKLKEIYRIPWIADFRDGWTQNHYYPYSRFRKKKEQKLEIQTLSNADIITTVSKPLAHKLVELHNNQINVITNGFNPDDYLANVNLTPNFTITHTGTIYPEYQNIEPLFQALYYMLENQTWPIGGQLRFVGPKLPLIDKLANKYRIQNIVKQYGIVSYDESIKMQRESHVLILFRWNDPSQKGIYTTKLFEYIGAKRPIITIGKYSDITSTTINETARGINCYSNDLAGLQFAVKEISENQIYYCKSPTPSKYNQVNTAKQMANLLNEVINA